MKTILGTGTSLVLFYLCAPPIACGSFVNFETAPVHPLDLSPDGQVLAACNLPDARLELFHLTSGVPLPLADIPVGLDPVSIRFRTADEAWVVNHVSSSISILDISRRQIVHTIQTLPGPADVVFAGSRAFVSCARVNRIQVFDSTTRQELATVNIAGERPKALAVDPTRQKVYVAVFESGNASTILAPQIAGLDERPRFGPLDDLQGPYGGQVPPPNADSQFQPPINPNISTNYPPPKVGQIVKKNSDGRWLDDNNRDWTEYISGTNSVFSGRIQGWDMPDHDIAIIDAQTLHVSYINRLMNICMALAINPISGKISLVGTDATNERRFEANLRATFLRVNLAMVDPLTLQPTIKDLNPHLDYLSTTLPQPERDKSISDPRAIAWNSTGTRAYVTGMGSRNLLVLDTDGNRVLPLPIELSEGPTGLALDEPRHRLYVLNRFSGTIAVIDTAANTVLTNVPFFDPTPPTVKNGRKHFYDTRRNSGLGHTACASCHLDGRMDRLAWDLGNPEEDLLTITNVDRWERVFTRTYHPMKGPMVTQTLQDIIGHEPFHWRADREGIEQFNRTFTGLLGRDQLLTDQEMHEFKAFLATLSFPPNLARNIDDTLSTNVALPGLYGHQPLQIPLPNGSALRGRRLFSNAGGDVTCGNCHVTPTGLGLDDDYFLPGPNGEAHLRLQDSARTDFLIFKVPQMRNLDEKMGLDFRTTSSRAGFGFTHDGRADTLPEFIFQSVGFGLENDEDDQQLADLIAFLFSFSGSDPVVFDRQNSVIPKSLDVATAVGKQLTITSPATTPLLQIMLALADSPSNRIDLVVRGTKDGLSRGWYYSGTFLSDRHGEEIAISDLLLLASPDHPLTFTLVPRGTGMRVGIDRDNDALFDRTEIEAGLNHLDPDSRGTNNPPQLSLSTNYVIVHPGMLARFTATATETDPEQTIRFSLVSNAPPGAAIDSSTGTFEWNVPTNSGPLLARVYVRATDSGLPNLLDSKPVTVEVLPLRLHHPGFDTRPALLLLRWDAVPGLTYRLQFKSALADSAWTDSHDTITADGRQVFRRIDYNPNLSPVQYFQLRTEP